MDARCRWFGRARVADVCALAWLGLTGAAVAQPTAPAYKVLHDFRGDLSAVWGGVTLGPDGSIYATTYDGGTSNKGSVFVLRPDGSGGYSYQTLHDFTGGGDDGASPAAGLLVASDGNLYGTTMLGGSHAVGAIFRIDGTTGQIATLHSFSYDDGIYPRASLIEGSGGLLYGTTSSGGLGAGFTQGTTFKMDLAGTFTTLHVFTGSGGDGASPLAALIQGSDGFFYGTTSLGGNTGEGTVFKMGPSGAVTVLHSFAGATEGISPHGSLAERAGAFYGTTNNGGPNGWGTVFRIDASGALATVHAFAGVDGALPAAGLLLASDTSLYGTTRGGGSGTVFRISPAGAFVTLHNFVGSDGARPQAGLVEGADGALYGTTSSSGGLYAVGQGTVFRMDPSGAVTTLYGFSGDLPAIPWGGLVQATNGIYGATIAGGSGEHGTLFQMTPAGAVSTLHSFQGADGSAPFAALVEATDGNLYGVASEGGAGGLGTVFRLEPSGTVTTLHEFGSSDGGTPRGRLIQASDGNLYGTTFRGGGIANARGTIFRISLTGTLTLLHSFDGSDGGEPLGGVIEGKDGSLYGTTSGGGANDKGAVFRFDPSGVFTPIHSFDGNDGWAPQAGLVEAADGNLYGTTAYGGLGGQGTLFRISSSGVPSVLHNFTFAEGQPYSRLLEASDGNLYGTTTLGAAGYGSIFRVDSAGTVTLLHSLQPNDGAYPYGDLVQLNSGALWGVTYGGGAWNRGVAFELALGLTPPTAIASGSAKVCNGSAAPLSGSGGVSCSWSPVAGLDDPSSCTPSASPANTTTYTLTVTDAVGQRSVNKPTVTVTADCQILSVSPKVLDFGQVPLNKTKDLVLTVTNDTAAPVALFEIFRVEQGNPQPFDASAFDGCRALGARILNPGDSCTQTVRFWSVPGADAASPATMRLSDGNTFQTLASVTLLASTGPPVTGPNIPPIAVDDLGTIAPGVAVPLNPLANDSDPDNDLLRIIAVSDPPHGTAAVAPCDSFPLNRNEDCVQYVSDAGYEGPDSFVYTISDGRGGTATATYRLAVGNLTPTIASVTPGSGPTAGGQSVRITGTNFLYRSDVAFLCGHGSTFPLTVTQLTDTEILATTPPAPAGTCDLQVRSPFGHAGQLTGAYTYIESVTPTNGGLVSGTIVAVNTGPGDQTGPHVDGDLMTYTDVVSSQDETVLPGIRYYRFSTGVDEGIPDARFGERDILSDVNRGRITFSRVRSGSSVAAMLFDTTTPSPTPTEIDPRAGSQRYSPTIGGGTVAFEDLSVAEGDIAVWDLASARGQFVGESPLTDARPRVSPEGQAIVWEVCGGNCDIFKAFRDNLGWTASPVANTSDSEENPDTDGTWIAYDASSRDVNPNGSSIYLTPLAGGPAVRLALPGLQVHPHISRAQAPNQRGVISFESRATSSLPGDIYVYVIATNTVYQVTDTPSVDDILSDVSVLPNGDIRVVWAANDGAAGDYNVYAKTFRPGHAPVAVDDAYTTNEETPINIPEFHGQGVLANDVNVGGGTAVAITLPTRGPLTFRSDGSFDYAPFGRYVGSDTFTYKVTVDGMDSNVATVTITIAPVDHPPVATDDDYATGVAALTVPVPGVLGNDTDLDGDPLTAVLVSGPGQGTLVLNPDGSFTYTPNAGALGDSFTYQAIAHGVPSNVATVRIGPAPDFQGVVSSTRISINAGPGDQTDPHVDGDLMTYTDAQSSNSSQIRYYKFSTAVDQGIPAGGPGEADILSDVNAGRITFNRLRSASSSAVMLFDTTAMTLTEIDAAPGSSRLGTTIGGATIAFTDLTSGSGDIRAWDLPSAQGQVVGASPFVDKNPHVSPDGQAIVWERCQGDCDVFKALRVNGSWTVSGAANSPDNAQEPDTDGTWVVYDADRVGHTLGPNVYLTPWVGGSEVRLALPGVQAYPRISHGVISFDSRPPLGTTTDIYVYVIATNKLYQVTDTPNVAESLSDLSVLPNGDIRVVWAADEPGTGNHNVYATTFTPGPGGPPPVAADDAYTTNEDTPLSVAAPGVLTNDANVTGGTAAAITQPTHGTLAFRSDGSFDYTPNANFFGTDTFGYKVTVAGVESNLAAVTLTINAVDDAPVAVVDIYSIRPLVALTVPAPGVLSNDIDADGDPLTAVLVSGPTHGVLNLAADGSFTYMPGAGGPVGAEFDTFTYRALGAGIASNIATVSLRLQWTLQVTNGGSGSVRMDPPGIVCAPSCTATFDDGLIVRLTATADAGYVFDAWSGSPDCRGANPILLVPMNADQSCNATFKRADTVPPTVALSTPNGGERVFTGTPYVIRWSASDNVGVTAIDVAFSSNGGSTFAAVAGCTGLPGNAQSCTWPAPGPATAQGRIRVTVRDAAGLSASTMSNANFSVVAGTASLTLTAPTTAVAWRIADTHAIRITHNLGVGQKVSIDLSRDGGGTWSAINPAFVTTSAATGVFNWVVAGPPTTAARFRVTWSGNPTSVASASGVNFAILDRINLTTPDTAVTWPIGSTRAITWGHNLGVSETVNIDLSRDGGLTWNALATNLANATAATGRFNWVVTGPATTAARVRVSSAANPSLSSMSPVNFTISGTIATTAPTGAASWGIGSQRTITWNHNLGAGQLFDITLSTNGGSTFPTIIATGVSGGATSGSYAWAVSGPASTTARIRVTWASSSAVAGTTGNFTMAAPAITLTAPNTAVNWAIGTTRTLTWTHNLGTQESVSIEASTNGGATWNPIATGTPNAGNATGSYDWLVSGPPSTTERVRVRWAANPAVAGQSAVNFTVANPFVTVTSPNTAVTWAIGSTHNITFNHNLGTGQAVTIALTRDGVIFAPLTTLTTTSATTGTFSWTVAGPGTTTARIRATWSGNATVTDVSNASFRIQ